MQERRHGRHDLHVTQTETRSAYLAATLTEETMTMNRTNRLKAMRGPGESYSDVILRIAERNERDNQGNWRSFATSASSGPITRSFRSTSNWAGLS